LSELWDTLSFAFEPLRNRPWLLLMLFGLPYWGLAAWRRVFPNGTQVALLIVPTVLTLALQFEPRIWPAVFLVDAIWLILISIDFWTLPRRKQFGAAREVVRVASLLQPQKVTLTITNSSSRSCKIWVRDDAPQEFQLDPKQFDLKLAPRSRNTISYEFTPKKRGAFTLACVHIRCRSWFGLWQRYHRIPDSSVVHVYPDMKQLGEYAVLARTNRLSLVGVRRTRKIGADNEFERLRDYTRDDNYKHIDWRTTARRQRLTVKDFQQNQSQRIIFMLDCGRMMTNESGGISLLDHSLNAMLMMSYVALRQGDSVGLVSFSDRIHNFAPPRGGMSQMNRLLHASFDRFPKLVESRYDEAFKYLAGHCSKRSLVVLMTNVLDEVNSFQIQRYLGSLVGKHLPLGVLLRDHELFDAADKPNPHGKDLYRAAAAANILSWRHQVLVDLEHQGVLAIDTFAEDMTAKMVNRYLEIKARHLL